VSKQGKTKHELWLRLCDLISNNPDAGRHLKVQAIIRQGLARFTDQVGRLWTSLANYYIRLGNFEQARDIFEEALNSVVTVRDFAHVWDAYTQFEDTIMSTYMESRTDQSAPSEQDELDFELRLARYEYLIDRRPLLLSSVMLRQNPHNVYEWQKRAKLYTNARSIVETYTRALKTVDPLKATGKPHVLWINFAKFYEAHNDLDSARSIFERATQVRHHLQFVWFHTRH
jgi:pre-mRNA-splicing factor SYF1